MGRPIEIIIPYEKEFRGHLALNLLTVITLNKTFELLDFPPIAHREFIDIEAVQRLHDKIKNAKPNKELIINERELLLNYTCLDSVNRMLIREEGEELFKIMLEGLTEDHNLKTFKAFREYMFACNAHMMRDSETKFKKMKSLTELRKKLNGWA